LQANNNNERVNIFINNNFIRLIWSLKHNYIR